MVTQISRHVQRGSVLTGLSKTVQQKAVVADVNPHHRRERKGEWRDCDSGSQRDRQMREENRCKCWLTCSGIIFMKIFTLSIHNQLNRALFCLCFNRIWIIRQFKVISISLPRMPFFSVQIKRIQIQLNSVTSSGYMRGAVCLDRRPLPERARVFFNAHLRHKSAPDLRMFNQPAGFPWRWRCRP